MPTKNALFKSNYHFINDESFARKMTISGMLNLTLVPIRENGVTLPCSSKLVPAYDGSDKDQLLDLVNKLKDTIFFVDNYVYEAYPELQLTPATVIKK